MISTYIASSNAASGGTVINAGGPAEIKKLLIGAPVTSANILIFEEQNPGGITNTAGLLAKITLPGTLATGQLPFVLTLEDAEGKGLQLPQGGNVMIDQTLQLTVFWAVSEEGTQAN